MKRIGLLILLALFPMTSVAQKTGISMNILEYAHLGTINGELSYSLTQRWSVTVGIRYNPFTYNEGRADQFQHRQMSLSAGARFWPWHTLSGWWFASKLRWQEYNFGGLFTKRTEEGDRFGAGVYAGYTHMLSPHFNIEFGAGLWSGVSLYTVYDCPRCGFTQSSGMKYFLLPDDFMISLVYVF